MNNRMNFGIAAIVFLALSSFLLFSVSAPTPPQVTGRSLAQLPPPVGTYYPPTITPEPYKSPTPTVTLTPPPAPTSIPPSLGPAPNIVWSAETDNILTIWAGRYSDNPSPTIGGVRPIARWSNIRLSLLSWAVSPDHKSLALLMVEPCVYVPEPTPTPDLVGTPQPGRPNTGTGCEGDWPEHIYVIDLTTNKVQSIPDYYNHYQIYAENSYPYWDRILGWFDNERFGIVQKNGQMITATKDGSSFVKRTWPGQSQYDSINASALLPDNKTIFAWVGNSFFFRDAPTGSVYKVGNRIRGVAYVYLSPSPDGRLISYLEHTSRREGNNGRHYELWVQHLASDSRNLLIGSNVWDTEPAWSPDSSQIAFARADSIPTAEDAYWIGYADKADTNIYIADIATSQSRQLTSFAGEHNRDIRWTPGGNLLLSSTQGSSINRPGIVAISTVDGTATTLVSAALGESLVCPLLFGPGVPTGMPRAGAEPNQPAPGQPPAPGP